MKGDWIMIGVIGILLCIVCGMVSMKNGVIKPDTFYIALSIYVTGLLIREGKRAEENRTQKSNNGGVEK